MSNSSVKLFLPGIWPFVIAGGATLAACSGRGFDSGSGGAGPNGASTSASNGSGGGSASSSSNASSSSSSSSSAQTTSSSASSSSSGSGGAGPTPLPIGKATITPGGDCGPTTSVPTSACYAVAISGCEGVANTSAALKVSEPSVPVIGTIIFGSGGGGGALYEQNFPNTPDMLNSLLAKGYRLVQRRWAGNNGWMTGPGGGKKLACRYATLIRAVHDQIHKGGAYCATGNSGGAAELSYALARYGMESILDLAVPTSGPPLGRIDYGCLGTTDPTWAAECPQLAVCGGSSCGYAGPVPAFMDSLYGDPNVVKDCQNKNKANAAAWYDDSVVSPSSDYDYPQTEVRFLFGAQDCSEAMPLGKAYELAITSKKSEVVVPATPHGLPGTVQGAEAVKQALLAGCVVNH